MMELVGCKPNRATLWYYEVLMTRKQLRRETTMKNNSTPGTRTFSNGGIWPDTAGVHINAHGGGLLKEGGLWYWYGEHKTAGKAGNVANVGVHVYSSPNLLEWTDRGIALPVEPDEASDIAWRLATRDVKCQIFKFHEHDVLDFRDVKCYNRIVHVPKGVLHVRWKKRIP